MRERGASEKLAAKARWVTLLAAAAAVSVIATVWLRWDDIVAWYWEQRIGFRVREGEWPMLFGSPSRTPVSDTERRIPIDFDLETGRNVRWVADLGSQHYGTAVVAGGKIFIGTNNERARNRDIQGDRGVVMCFRESDGEFLWQAVHDKLPSGRVNDWPQQGVASTGVVEDGRLYYVSNRCELVCADVEGFLDGENDGPYVDEKYASEIDADFIWKLDMMGELRVFPHNLAASSPAISHRLVYVLTSNGVDSGHINLPSPDAPSFIAVDKYSGRVVWTRNDPGKNVLHGQWSSPSIGYAGGRTQVVFPCGDGWVYSCDPATGALLWKFDCNPKDAVWTAYGGGDRNDFIAPAAFVDGRVYIAVGEDPEHGEGIGHLYSIDAAGSGDVTSTRQVWHYGGQDYRRSLSTPAVWRDLVFAVDLSGFLHCLDRETGRVHWVHDTLAAVWGSPFVADGKVFLGDEDGDLVVLAASSTLRLLFETNFGNSIYSTPLVSNGVLYVSTRTKLYAIAAEE